MPPRSRGRVGQLWQRVAGYGDVVRTIWADPTRPWRASAGPTKLLDEEYLRRLERLSLSARRAIKLGLVGEHHSVRKAHSIEFADYRRYVAGDDFRRIDWNAYGRLDELFVKLTEAREDVALHLLLDGSRSMDWGEPSKLFYAKQTAAAIGYIALSRYDAVVAASFGDGVRDYLPILRGQGHTLALFDFLNHVNGDGETDLLAAANAYCARTPQRGVAIVISDLLLTRGLREGLNRLVSHGLETAVVHLLDIEELEPTFRGDVELVDLENGERIEMTVGPEAIRSYQLGVKYVRLNTAMPFERMVIQYLRARRLVS
jgi:uncharacterized protein (DUF58 family)